MIHQSDNFVAACFWKGVNMSLEVTRRTMTAAAAKRRITFRVQTAGVRSFVLECGIFKKEGRKRKSGI